MSRLLLLFIATCSITELAAISMHSPSHVRQPGRGHTSLRHRQHPRHIAGGLPHVLRGGQDDEQELSDMMSNMMRLSEEATKNPPLPPLAEAAVRVRNLDFFKCHSCDFAPLAHCIIVFPLGNVKCVHTFAHRISLVQTNIPCTLST